jgi:hypothetical protein
MVKVKAVFLFVVSFLLPSIAMAAGDLDDMTMEIIMPEQPSGNQLQLPDVRELQSIDEHMLQQPRESHDLGFEVNGLDERAIDSDAYSNIGQDGLGGGADPQIETTDPGLRYETIDNMDLLREFFEELPEIQASPDKSEVLIGGV